VSAAKINVSQTALAHRLVNWRETLNYRDDDGMPGRLRWLACNKVTRVLSAWKISRRGIPGLLVEMRHYVAMSGFGRSGAGSREPMGEYGP
jgi:hypothetical protein